jgi:hypothetical protein
MRYNNIKQDNNMSIPGPKKSYCTLVDEQLEANEAKNKSYFPLRPSASGYCARKLAHDLNVFHGNEPKPEDPKPANIIRLLNLGHSIEFHALKYLNDIPGFNIKFKQQVVDMFKLERTGQIIEGSTDAVMWSNESKGLLDVKSVGDRFHSAFGTKWNSLMEKYDTLETFERFDENAWYINDLPAAIKELGDDTLVTNLTQINLYLCTQFMQDRGLDHGVVYRYNKNNSTHMEIRFKPSPELFETVRKKFNAIDQAVAAGDPQTVPKEFTLGSQMCAFCPYKSKCWPEIDAKKEYFKTFPKKEWPTLLNERTLPGSLKLFDKLSALEDSTLNKGALEQEIIVAMQAKNLTKVKLPSGLIYEIKFLKSPKPHFELRRVNE